MRTMQDPSLDLLLAVGFLPQDLLLQHCLLVVPSAESSSGELELGRASWLAVQSQGALVLKSQVFSFLAQLASHVASSKSVVAALPTLFSVFKKGQRWRTLGGNTFCFFNALY